VLFSWSSEAEVALDSLLLLSFAPAGAARHTRAARRTGLFTESVEYCPRPNKHDGEWR
jgi:hypothetical protein